MTGKKILDEMIAYWRESDEDFAHYYVDALQSYRTNEYGTTKPMTDNTDTHADESTDDRTADDNPRMEYESDNLRDGFQFEITQGDDVDTDQLQKELEQIGAKATTTIDPNAHDDRTFRPFGVPDRLERHVRDDHAANQVLHDALRASDDFEQVDLMASHARGEKPHTPRYHVRVETHNGGSGDASTGPTMLQDLIKRRDVDVKKVFSASSWPADMDAEDVGSIHDVIDAHVDRLVVLVRPVETRVDQIEVDYGDLPNDVKTHAQLVNKLDGLNLPDGVRNMVKHELTDGEFGDVEQIQAELQAEVLGGYEIGFDIRDGGATQHIINKEKSIYADKAGVSAYPAVCGESGAWDYPPSQPHPEYDADVWCPECRPVAEALGHVEGESRNNQPYAGECVECGASHVVESVEGCMCGGEIERTDESNSVFYFALHEP